MNDPKPVEWLATTLEDMNNLRDGLQDDLGFNLYLVQIGKTPTSYRPMPSVGPGVYELRAADKDGIARLMYVAKFDDAVYVLHVFVKKTRKTPDSDIEKAKTRYKEIGK